MDSNLLLLIIPLVVIQVGLQIFALLDLYRNKRARHLPVMVWVGIVILGSLLGTVLYFAVGREDAEVVDEDERD